ncbi:alpha/beta hydrolase [Thalassobaculum sp. OXR-137]|uniref:alpha/beta fold hydrolase n=1 Tax=Thalassobaculum sp. OXR-137 TaxID=3100173 RepID=UPI002AC964D8|nr:alpha/beta hydrolase [Thalassobaculum sp. OXR-137]WPZ35021.1 alpha/beta hydrolase [Thalassobaculum sp. OXR-137]
MTSPLRNTIIAVAAAAAVAGSSPADAASRIADDQAVRTVVLVHGAFADGSGWRGVYDELTARGYRVAIVQNPLTSFEDDVNATRRILARQEGPSILVGHSYGGSVITEAGTDPNVAGLVYVSALAPDVGESTGDQFAEIPAPKEFVIETGADGFGFVNRELFQAGFAGDTSDPDAAFLRDSQVPINMAIFGTRLTQAAWRSKPSWAVVATQDHAIDPRLLRQQADRIGAEVVEVEASHVPFLTQPLAVADVIDRAARTVSQAATR